MLDELVVQGIEESDSLDYKKELPAQKELARSDFPKDVAAFANAGGGVLVFGVTEESRRATGRLPIEEVTETYERTLRQVAVSAIFPPVFGLELAQVGDYSDRALIVNVPPSLDRPHLVYRNEYFGAPLRNHADTVWMRERQIEQMYRSRFEAWEQVDRAIDELYDEAAAGHDTAERAWLIAVAVPRLPRRGLRPDGDVMRSVIDTARQRGSELAGEWVHPFDAVDYLNPRRGMRRWVLRNMQKSNRMRWKQAWISILDNGSVALAMTVGGYPMSSTGEEAPGCEVSGRSIECCVADLVAVIGEVTRTTGPHGEYDLRLGIEWTGEGPLLITTFDRFNFRLTDDSVPLANFTPLRTSVRPDTGGDDLRRQAYEIALDAVNQGGVQNIQLISSSTAG